jgi:choline dehydrogenase-like flavoprotein
VLIDARQLDPDSSLTAAYCVVGTGMGGAAVAQVLAHAGEDVLLVDAGGLERDGSQAALVEAEHIGRPFGIPLSRCLEIGGTANQWHGVCATLDDIDFAARPWIGAAGWPIDRRDLDPYYRRAAQLLGIADPDTTELARLDGARRGQLSDIAFDRGSFRNKVVQVCRPPKRWKDVLVALARDRRCRCLHNAPALELIAGERGDAVQQLVVGTARGSLSISARVFVICAGALETPRLLLNSNRRIAAGIGNGSDQVGRYLLDHPVGHYCKLGFRRPLKAPLYASLPINGSIKLMAGLMMSPAAQEQERVANHCLWIRPSVTPARLDDGLLYSFLAVRGASDLTMRQVRGLMFNPDLLYRVLVQRFGWHPRYRYGDLFFMTEQLPNRESRVDLSATRKDAFGYPIARVNWQLSGADFAGFAAYARVLFERGLRDPQYSLARVDGDDVWRDTVASAAHHLGTARMAASAADGVVDRDLRVFGMRNVFVGDGSVFPTAGGVNPSLTITALAVRLGEHLLATRHNSQ